MVWALVGSSQKSGCAASVSSLAIFFSLPAMSKTHHHIVDFLADGFKLFFYLLHFRYEPPFVSRVVALCGSVEQSWLEAITWCGNTSATGYEMGEA